MKLLSIQVGLPQTYGSPAKKTFDEKQWETGFYKSKVEGTVRATRTGLFGDGQADLKVHGGPDKAVCVYPSEHFPFWRDEHGLQMHAGAFGENFTSEGLREGDVCIGDKFDAAGTVFEVSQPRQPCWKLARRWGLKKLPLHVQESGRTGWYFRVVVEGDVFAPTTLTLIERPNESWTIARCNEIMHKDKANLDLAAELSKVVGLSESWRTNLSKRASKAVLNTERERLEGERE